MTLPEWAKLYDGFDAGHDARHRDRVERMAVELATVYAPDRIVAVRAAAILHDVGLSVSRDNHEAIGADIILADEDLRVELGEDFPAVVEAVREHRSSTGCPQGTIAKIVSDADRASDTAGEKVERALSFSIMHGKGEGLDHHLRVAREHITHKFGPGGRARRVYYPETLDHLVAMYSAVPEDCWDMWRQLSTEARDRIIALLG